MQLIAEQVVAVMGASSGIGRATALRSAEQGAAVVVATPQRARAEVPPAPRQSSADDAAGVARLPAQARVVTILNVS